MFIQVPILNLTFKKNDKDPKSEVGNHIRISKYNNIFEKI